MACPGMWCPTALPGRIPLRSQVAAALCQLCQPKKLHRLVSHGIVRQPEDMAWFQGQWDASKHGKLDTGKSCIRFKNTAKIPWTLLEELAKRITPEAMDFPLRSRFCEMKHLALSCWFVLLSWVGTDSAQAQMQWWPTEVSATSRVWVAEGGHARRRGIRGIRCPCGMDDTPPTGGLPFSVAWSTGDLWACTALVPPSMAGSLSWAGPCGRDKPVSWGGRSARVWPTIRASTTRKSPTQTSSQWALTSTV